MASEVTCWVLSVNDSTQKLALHQFSTAGELLETVDTTVDLDGDGPTGICAQNDIIVFGQNQYLHTVLADRSLESYDWGALEALPRILRIQIIDGAFYALCMDYYYDNRDLFYSSDGINWTQTPFKENSPSREAIDVYWASSDNKFLVLFGDPSGESAYGDYSTTTDFITFSAYLDHIDGYTFSTPSGNPVAIYFTNGKFYQAGRKSAASALVLAQTGTNGIEYKVPLDPAYPDSDYALSPLFFDTADNKLTLFASPDANPEDVSVFKLASDEATFDYAGSPTDAQEALLAALSYSISGPELVLSTSGYVGLGYSSTVAVVTGASVVPLEVPTGYTLAGASGPLWCIDARDVSLFWTENIRTREYL